MGQSESRFIFTNSHEISPFHPRQFQSPPVARLHYPGASSIRAPPSPRPPAPLSWGGTHTRSAAPLAARFQSRLSIFLVFARRPPRLAAASLLSELEAILSVSRPQRQPETSPSLHAPIWPSARCRRRRLGVVVVDSVSSSSSSIEQNLIRSEFCALGSAGPPQSSSRRATRQNRPPSSPRRWARAKRAGSAMTISHSLSMFVLFLHFRYARQGMRPLRSPRPQPLLKMHDADASALFYAATAEAGGHRDASHFLAPLPFFSKAHESTLFTRPLFRASASNRASQPASQPAPLRPPFGAGSL